MFSSLLACLELRLSSIIVVPQMVWIILCSVQPSTVVVTTKGNIVVYRQLAVTFQETLA